MESLSTKTGTREQLLNTAERLFAEKGFAATSLREITSEAGANIASIHYHFGSKQDLIREVFSRRCRPLNEARLHILDGIEESGPLGEAHLDKVLAAFVGPVVEMRWGGEGPGEGQGPEAFARLIGRVMGDPKENLESLLHEEFKVVFQRFTAAIHACLPDLPRGALLERFQFAVGAMAHCIVSQRLMDMMDPEFKKPVSPEEKTRALVSFLRGGFCAPVTS